MNFLEGTHVFEESELREFDITRYQAAKFFHRETTPALEAGYPGIGATQGEIV